MTRNNVWYFSRQMYATWHFLIGDYIHVRCLDIYRWPIPPVFED